MYPSYTGHEFKWMYKLQIDLWANPHFMLSETNVISSLKCSHTKYLLAVGNIQQWINKKLHDKIMCFFKHSGAYDCVIIIF